MTLIQRRHDSGLVVAEEAMDERAITAAIKRINPRYVLQKHRREGVEGGLVYKVLYNWSDSHPAKIVLTWMDEYGNPRPLSSGIVELVEKHQLGARNVGPTAEEANEAYQRRVEADADALGMEIVREHAPRLKGRVQVSLAHKQRKQSWQKQNGGRITR